MQAAAAPATRTGEAPRFSLKALCPARARAAIICVDPAMSATFDVIETRKRSGTDDWEVQIKRRDRAPSYGPGQRHQQNEGWWVTHEEITDERFGAPTAYVDLSCRRLWWAFACSSMTW